MNWDCQFPLHGIIQYLLLAISIRDNFSASELFGLSQTADHETWSWNSVKISEWPSLTYQWHIPLGALDTGCQINASLKPKVLHIPPLHWVLFVFFDNCPTLEWNLHGISGTISNGIHYFFWPSPLKVINWLTIKTQLLLIPKISSDILWSHGVILLSQPKPTSHFFEICWKLLSVGTKHQQLIIQCLVSYTMWVCWIFQNMLNNYKC